MKRSVVIQKKNPYSEYSDALKSNSLEVRSQAMNELIKISKRVKDEDGRKTVASVVEGALHDELLPIRLVSIQLLGDIGHPGSIKRLTEALEKSGDAIERASAADALGRIRDIGSVGPLIKALSEREQIVRSAALTALAGLGDIARPSLLKARRGMDNDVAWLAGRALGLEPEPRAPKRVLGSLDGVARMFAEQGKRVRIQRKAFVSGRVLSEMKQAGIALDSIGAFPIVVYADSGVAEACGKRKVACHIRQTNIILIDQREMEWNTLDHEIAHYINWLVSGGDMFYYRDGMEFRRDEIRWLNEGMAEGISMGLKRRSWIYPRETQVILRLVEAAGSRAVRQAFYSGDFRNVQEKTDLEYGSGAFERMMDSRTPEDALEILSTLVARK